MAMDPLPTIDKAYYMVQKLERQNQITSYTVVEPIDFFSFHNNAVNRKKDFKKPRDPNQRRFYEYCKSEGHTFETCFERVGHSDWWKRLKKCGNATAGKRNLKFKKKGNLVGDTDIRLTPLDEEPTIGIDKNILENVYQEVCKLIQLKMGSNTSSAHSDTSSSSRVVNFVGVLWTFSYFNFFRSLS